MTQESEATGISVHGTSLSAEETAALLAVVDTQLITTPAKDAPADHATRDRITSTWADNTSWQMPPKGH